MIENGYNQETTDVICLGQAVIDCVTRNRIPDPERLGSSTAESIVLRPGGDAVNESTALIRMGRRVQPVFAIGDDAAGAFLLHALEELGLDTSRVVRMGSSFQTPIANIFVEKDGSRSSISSQAVKLPGFQPTADLIKGARVVSLCSIFRAPLDDPGTLAALVSAAKAQGSVVCADTKLPLYKKQGLEDFKEALSQIDFIFPNEKEAAYYAGRKHYEKVPGRNNCEIISGRKDYAKIPGLKEYEEMAEVFLSSGVRNVVIKAGKEGCFSKNADEFMHIPALPVQVVDTTGAGDYFVAGFISALLDGSSFRICCEAGIESAARRIGRFPGDTL